MRTWLAAAAALVAMPALATAQESVRIEPREAMQCAVWASIFSQAVEDPSTQTALLYALSYFVGHYEGATGQSIKDGHDEAAVSEVARDPDAFSERCQAHAAGYGPRMIAWGEVLDALGQSLDAAAAAPTGK